MKVLILEDARKLAETWRDAMVALGHTVVHFMWVTSIGDGVITGRRRIDPHGSAVMEIASETVNLAEFDLALVDGFLGMPGEMGWTCLPHLALAGVGCITTSSFGDIGGSVEMEKEDVLPRLAEVFSYARQREAV